MQSKGCALAMVATQSQLWPLLITTLYTCYFTPEIGSLNRCMHMTMKSSLMIQKQ